MLPSNVSETVTHISKDRLDSYRNYFNLISDEECLGLYLWNDALSSSFFKLVSIFEVSLRNTIHKELSRQFNTNRTQGSAFDNDWYEHLITNNYVNEISKKHIRKATHIKTRTRRKATLIPKRPVTSPGKVIASQSFGFWGGLIENTTSNVDWKSVLFNGLKGHFASNITYWTQSSIDDFIERLSEVNELRNRIAHHEPIWKFTEIKHHRTKTIIYSAATNPSESLTRMMTLNSRICRILGWISEDRKNDYLNSHYKRHFDWLVSQQAIDTYKFLSNRETIKLTKAKRNLNNIFNKHKIIEIVGKDQILTIIPGVI